MISLSNIIFKSKSKPFIALYIVVFVLSIIITIGLNIYHRTYPREFPDSWSTFAHEKYDYVIDYPENWRAQEFPHGNHGDLEAIGSISEGMRCFGCVRLLDVGPIIYIAYKEMESPTLDQVLTWGEERIAKKAIDQVYQLKDTQTAEINGHQAAFRTYDRKDHISRELEPAIDAYILREDSAIIFSLNVEPKDYEELLPVFEYVVNSFR